MPECKQCGECCLKAPCQIPVVHMDALRYILVNEFKKPEKVSELDIVEILFSYHEDILPSGQVAGFFSPIPKRILNNGDGWCMWLKKKGNKLVCTLFWNKTSEILVGFAEQVVGKGKGCTLANPKMVPVLPMVYRNHTKSIVAKEIVK